MNKSKKFLILSVIILIFCFFYEAGHSYVITGYGHEQKMWNQTEEGTDFILDGFSLGLNRGEYSLTFGYQNKSEKDITFRVLDMEHNDGDNHLGIIVAKGTLEPGTHTQTIQFKLTQDSYKLELHAEKEFEMYDWYVKLIEDSYTDGVFFCALLIGILYLVYFKLNWKKPQYTAIVCAAAIVITLPLAGDILQGGHDMAFHMSRIKGIAESLSNGQFPVRMNTDINQGYGFVSEILYPNLFVYFPALLTLLGMSVIVAYKYWILFINIATALLGYYSFSKLLKSEKMGMVCSFLYLVNPYRLNNIYLRASIGEVLAQIFLPLLVYALMEVIYGDYKKWWILAISAIGILQSHILSLEICVLFVALFCLISWRKLFCDEGGRRMVSCLKAATITIILNLWFLVPFLDQFRYEYNLVSEKGDIYRSTVYLYQMFLSYFRVAGGNVLEGVKGEMPLTIGSGLLIGSVCYIYYAYGIRQIHGRTKKIGDFSLLFGGISCYMASNYFPWAFLQKNCTGVYDLLSKMQYPWRMLGFASLFFSIVTAIAISELIKSKKRGMAYTILIISVILMVESLDGYFIDNDTIASSRNQNSMTAIYLDYYQGNITYSNLGIFQKQGPRVVTQEETAIKKFKKKGTDLSFQFVRTHTKEPAYLRIPLYNYGLHKAYLDGEEIEIQPGAYGMIAVEVPAGVSQGNIEVRYVGRKLYRAADICSFFAILCVVVYAVQRKRKLLKL